jgi:hypothetical protein
MLTIMGSSDAVLTVPADSKILVVQGFELFPQNSK